MSYATFVAVLVFGCCLCYVGYYFGHKRGKEEGVEDGMEQFLSIMKVYDETGEVVEAIEKLLKSIDLMSMDVKRDKFEKYIDRNGLR